MKNRLEAYAKAFGISIDQENGPRESGNPGDDLEKFSTTGTIREAFDSLSDGDMLVVPIGGAADDFK